MPPRKSNPPAPGTFGATLQMHRDRLGLTQDGAADLFPGWMDGESLPRRTWQNWESGEIQPPDYVQQLIIDKLSKTKPKKS